MAKNIEDFKYTKKHFVEFFKCKEDPIYFIKNYFNVQHPSRGIIKLDLYDYQESLICDYVDNRFNIVKAARQVGTTITNTAFILWFNIFHDDKTTLIAADKFDNAKDIMQRIRFAYETLPEWLRLLIKAVEINKSQMSFDNGSRIVAQATSPCTGRGMAVSLLYVDSLAFVKPHFQEEFWTSLRPTLSTGGRCIISSSPKDHDDIFANIWYNAEGSKNGFHRVHVPWYSPRNRDDNFKQGMINLIGERRWRQEYECEFIVN